MLQSLRRPARRRSDKAMLYALIRRGNQAVASNLRNSISSLKTLWASRLEDVEAFYNPTNIVTIIGHITKKVPYQEDVGDCYSLLCEVAHPNMLGRSLFLSEEDGRTVISRKRGPSATVIERASLLALSWAAGTLPRSLTAMQHTCVKMAKDLERFSAKVSSGWTPPTPGKSS